MREAMEIHQARPAQHLLDLRAAVQRSQHTHELVLAVGARGEIRVAAFGGHRQQMAVDEVQIRLPEARSRRDDCRVAVLVALAALQNDDLGIVQHADAVGHRLEIVEQRDMRCVQPPRDLRG